MWAVEAKSGTGERFKMKARARASVSEQILIDLVRSLALDVDGCDFVTIFTLARIQRRNDDDDENSQPRHTHTKAKRLVTFSREEVENQR